MANYTQDVRSPTGTTYFQGIIKPWDDYVLVATGTNNTILVTGDFVSDSGSQITFEDATVYTLTRPNNTSNYVVSKADQTTTTISYSSPYYMYSNTMDLAPAMSCTVAGTFQAYLVSFCCIVFVIDIVIGNAIKFLSRRMGR